MTEAEKAYQYFVIAVPENEEQAKAYFWARKALQSTLTPPNEWVRVDEWLPDFDTEQILVTDGERYYISTRNDMVHIADREGIFIPGKSGAGVKITHWRPLPELPCRPSKETSQ